MTDCKTEVHSSLATDELNAEYQLPRPSVRYLKTVNIEDLASGSEIALNAQQYCVLLTNVPEFDRQHTRFGFLNCHRHRSWRLGW